MREEARCCSAILVSWTLLNASFASALTGVRVANGTADAVAWSPSRSFVKVAMVRWLCKYDNEV